MAKWEFHLLAGLNMNEEHYQLAQYFIIFYLKFVNPSRIFDFLPMYSALYKVYAELFY